MKIASLLAAFLAAASSLLPAEEVLSCFTNASWVTPHWRKFYAMDEFLGIKGYVVISSKRSFEVDPEAEYEISGTFRSPADQPKPGNFEGGFILVDDDGNSLPSYLYSNDPRSLTELAADVNPGDKVVKIKKAPQWKGGFIAFNAREDLSDLPNRDTFLYTKLAEDGDNLVLTLQAKIKKAYKAGTKVRCHNQKKLWTLNRFKIAPKEWTRFSGRIKGVDKTATDCRKWWPGAARARVFILVPLNAGLEFKDVTVRKLTAGKPE